jgi:PAS domain S-box-containing protein
MSRFTRISKDEHINSLQKENAALRCFNDTLQNGSVVILQWSNAHDFPVEHVTPNVHRIFGYSVEDFTSGTASILDLLSKADRHVFHNFFSTLNLAHQTNYCATFRAIHKDGSELNLFINTEVSPTDSTGLSNCCSYILCYQSSNYFSDTENTLVSSQSPTNDEQKYRKLLNYASDAIFVADANSGIIIETNQAGSILLGKDYSEIIGLHQSELHPPNQKVHYSDLFINYSQEGKFGPIEAEVYHTNGRIIPVEISGSKLEYEQQSVILGLFRDISERKLAEKALKNERGFADKLINTAQAIILVLDAEGRIVRFNSYMESLSGYSLNEVQGKEWINIFLPEEYQSVIKAVLTSTIAGQDTCGHINPIITKDGKEYLIEWSNTELKDDENNTIGVIAIGLDITERQQREFLLQKSEALLNKSEMIAHIGSWELNLASHQLTWSDEVFRIFGYSPQEFVVTYNDFWERIHPDDREIVNAAYFESIKRGADSYEIEHRIIRHKSGEVRTVREKCEHVKNLSGQIVYSVGVVQDITELKHTKEELQHRDDILGFVAKLSDNFQISSNWKVLASHALAQMGRSTGVNSAILVEIRKKSKTEIISELHAEWHLHNGSISIDWKIHLIMSEMDNWLYLLSRGEIVSRKQSIYTKKEMCCLAPLKIASIIIIPIFLKENFWGFMSFIDHETERDWSDVEIASFKSVVGVLSAAIERDLVKSKLRESEQRFRDLVESSVDWIWEVDTNGKYIYSSPTVEILLGYKPEEIIGKTPFDLMLQEDAHRIRQDFSRIISEKKAFHGLENINYHKDGHLVTLETNGVPVFDEKGNLSGYRGIDRDISGRRQAEAERIANTERQKDILIRELHHRIKNHLQGLQGLLFTQKATHQGCSNIFEEAIGKIRSIATVYGLQSNNSVGDVCFHEMLKAIIANVEAFSAFPITIINKNTSSTRYSVIRDKAVVVSLIINELIVNAVKQFQRNHAQDAIQVIHQYTDDKIHLTISNSGNLPKGFDFQSGQGISTGLELLRDMIPHKGVSVFIKEKNNTVVAELILYYPVIVNNT